jgi:hypothetical protein
MCSGWQSVHTSQMFNPCVLWPLMYRYKRGELPSYLHVCSKSDKLSSTTSFCSDEGALAFWRDPTCQYLIFPSLDSLDFSAMESLNVLPKAWERGWECVSDSGLMDSWLESGLTAAWLSSYTVTESPECKFMPFTEPLNATSLRFKFSSKLIPRFFPKWSMTGCWELSKVLVQGSEQVLNLRSFHYTWGRKTRTK